MKKHFVRTILLILISLSSFGVTYYLVVNKDYTNPLLVVTFFAGCVGVFFLAKIGRGDHTIPAGPKHPEVLTLKKSLIEQQSELGSQYAKHATTRDKLRMLKGIKE